MTATIHRLPTRKPEVVPPDEVEQLKLIVEMIRASDRELREDMDNWEREIAAIVPRDYEEEE